MRKMKTIVVDDERLARQRLERLLLQEPDIELVGRCKNVQQARVIFDEGAPDLVFVDVQMPRESGFELLSQAVAAAGPAVIFVTAFEQYAVQAFEVKACDYLLKPVAEARLRVAVQRAREFLGRREVEAADDPAQAATSDLGDPQQGAVLVRTETKVVRVKLEAIDWLESAGNYVHLYVDGKSHLLRETLAAFEARLPAARFARIHRAVIVNLDRIVEFHPTLSGDFSVTLVDGTQLRMSRTYRGRIRDLFGREI